MTAVSAVNIINKVLPMRNMIAALLVIASSCFSGQGMEMLTNEGENIPPIFLASEILPQLSITKLTLENPEILPQVMLTCKKWNSATQDLWEATSFVFCKISKKNEGHIFKTVVFGQEVMRGKTINSSEVSLIGLYKEIRTLMTRYASYPDSFNTLYPSKKVTLCGVLKFSYLEMFRLAYQCHDFSDYDVKRLDNVRECFDLLSETFKNKVENHEFRMKIIPRISYDPYKNSNPYQIKDRSFHLFLGYINSKKVKNKFQTLINILLPLYKMAFVERDCGGTLFNNINDFKILDIMRRIPINFSTLSQDIIELQEKAEVAFGPAIVEWDELMQGWYHDAQMLKYYLQVG